MKYYETPVDEKNNLNREDLDLVIEHLKQNDPKLTSGLNL